jgi:4-amino-4-deoxy-L-arabinose transferase-like glycosyltransferase
VRVVQIALSLLTALVVYDLGRRVFAPGTGVAAAAVCWLYPTLVFLNFTILTETLFTLLLVVFVWLSVRLVQEPKPALALACGLALGLGALTRSVLWPLPVLLCPLMVGLLRGSLSRRIAVVLILFSGYAVLVVPWAIRNTRLQGVLTVVDTMGGMNLRMGNYEHTPDDRMWDAVSLRGEQNWVYAFTQEPHPTPATEGMKDKWAQRKALEYMVAHPGTTIRRAGIKFADLWGLERSFIAGVQQGLYAPPTWFAYAAAAAILLSYAAVAVLGGTGMWLARPAWRAHVLILLPVVVITGVHALAFGHSRYHVPLVPFLALYAAHAWQTRAWRSWRVRQGAAAGAAMTVLVLIVIWLRQVLFVDADRLGSLLEAIGT